MRERERGKRGGEGERGQIIGTFLLVAKGVARKYLLNYRYFCLHTVSNKTIIILQSLL